LLVADAVNDPAPANATDALSLESLTAQANDPAPEKPTNAPRKKIVEHDKAPEPLSRATPLKIVKSNFL
jgi:hypothetical protein